MDVVNLKRIFLTQSMNLCIMYPFFLRISWHPRTYQLPLTWNGVLELAASFSGSITRWMPASVPSSVLSECRDLSQRVLFTCFLEHRSRSHEEIPLNQDWLMGALYVFLVKLYTRLDCGELSCCHWVYQILLFTFIHWKHSEYGEGGREGEGFGCDVWNQIYCTHPATLFYF